LVEQALKESRLATFNARRETVATKPFLRERDEPVDGSLVCHSMT
jgi:hypothetical protein